MCVCMYVYVYVCIHHQIIKRAYFLVLIPTQLSDFTAKKIEAPKDADLF